jgi:predicted transcriptional regulator
MDDQTTLKYRRHHLRTGKGLLDHLSLLRSELKVKLLLNLLKSAKKLADFRADIKDTRDTTILHVLGEFESLGLVTKNQNMYQLTPMGIIEAEMIKEYISAMEVIDKFKDFWAQHKVASIPTKLLLNMGALKDGELVQSSASELGVVHQKFVDLVQESKRMYGTAPIFHPDFVLLVGHLLFQGSTIDLIVTKPVLEKILGLADYEDLKRYADSGHLTIYVKEDLEIALAVTDKAFSLGLFMLSGKYDDGMDLIAFSKDSLDWGKALFMETLKSSEKLNMEDFAKK